jgi:hypothetical protein
MAQGYIDPIAVERMRAGNCPECGRPGGEHDGAGGPGWCSLTDWGVAGRVAHQRDVDYLAADAERAAELERSVERAQLAALADGRLLDDVSVAAYGDEELCR